MIEVLKTWVVNFVTLVMLIVLLEMLVPKGKLKKIVSLVSGFILIITIITPILSLIKKGDELKEIQITQSTFLQQKELEASVQNQNKNQTAIILETYRNKLIRDVEENINAMENVTEVKADVIVEEDLNSKEFGKIKRLVVNLKVDKDSKGIKPVIAIKKINLKENSNTEKDESYISKELGDEVKNRLSRLYDVKQEQIAVGGL